VSPDLPPSASAKVEPILGHAEPPAPEAPVSPDLPPPDSAKVEPVLEHAEPPEVTGNVYTAQKDYDGATAKYNGTIKLDPKFPVAYENHNLTKGKTGEGSIGVTIRRVTDGAAHALNVKPACGALVIDIDENGPAKAAGIESRDVIVKVDGRDVKEWRDLPRIVADTSIGKEIAVTIVRNGKELTKTVKIGRLEYADEQASFSSQNGSAPQTKSVVVDAKSAAKHLAPAMAIVENKHQPLLLVPTAPPRFGKRPIDRFSRVSH
jgi:membrane-associated protease RseP (regulator of RpoE activity)